MKIKILNIEEEIQQCLIYLPYYSIFKKFIEVNI
jgi:hypothetical protein